jgi:hypothetical protein
MQFDSPRRGAFTTALLSLLLVPALPAADMSPLAVTGFNRDVVVENTAPGLPYSSLAVELNPGENLAFYQSGLPGKTYGLPVTGGFISELGDGTGFQFQPYDAPNALVLSSGTGVSAGTLTLVAPATFSRIAVIAHSAGGGGTTDLTLNFTDGTTLTTSYDAPDWFNNAGAALSGVERINLTTGGTSGATTNPRFYQTTLNLVALLGATNKSLASITFTKVASAGSTGIYAVSGEIAAETPVAITASPSNQTAIEAQAASFTAGVTGNPAPALQWFRGSNPIPGANQLAYTLPTVALGDHGATFRLVASNLANGVSAVVTSAPATLTVLADTNAPVLLGARSLGLGQVEARFSESLAPASVTNILNFTLTGTNGARAITGAVLDPSQSNVVLTVAALTDGATYTLTVNGLTDRAATPNLIAPDSQAGFSASVYVPASLGDASPSGSLVPVSGGFDLSGSGADLGGTDDQAQFNFLPRTGDFDVKVRLDSLSLADAWTEAGLVVREDLSSGARSAGVLATPTISGCYFQSRTTANGATTLSGAFPVNYPHTWLRLRRQDGTLTGYAGFDGLGWTQLGTVTLGLPATVYLGFAVSSHRPGELATAAFRDFADVTSATIGQSLPREPMAQCSRRTSLVISEIMYHPTNAALEYVELFNSRGEFADLSGYQLAGSISYTFPAGTILPGGGFLVVAASPAEVESTYAITGVQGPFTGNLPNSGGSVMLLNQAGGILLQVDYSDQPPWPVAADGSGHSLALVRPSYGEGDPLAWAASEAIGGSPGRLDPYLPDPLRAVVINEFLAHTDLPALDYVELYNGGNEEVDLSGAVLSDDPDLDKFVIPGNTRLPGRGRIYFTEAELGFALSAAGETIYFKHPLRTRVLDAIRFGGQENSVASGRWPDGAEQVYPLSAQSPGQPNAIQAVSPVVINELMYHPISEEDDDQYVELHNRTTQSVSLGGWSLSDGIEFTFPAGATIAPGGYVVVARSAARLIASYPALNATNTFGNFSGRLASSGERVALAKPDLVTSTNAGGVVTTNLIAIVVDEVTYGTGGSWPGWADGGGSSLERLDPRANARLAANWADSDETQKAPWKVISATGRVDNNSSTSDQLQILAQGAGEFLVDNVEVLAPAGDNRVANATFEADSSGWTAEGTMSTSGWEAAEGYGGGRSFRVRAVARGDNQINRLRTPLTSFLPSGTTNVTLRAAVRWLKGHPDLLLRLRGNGLECAGEMALPVNPGTPGARNSRAVTNAPPAIYAVRHAPTLPAAGEPMVFTARVDDPDGVISVQLRYRLDPQVSHTTVAMLDNGASGDAVAADGIYTATISGRAAGTLIAFYVQAWDGFTPPASSLFPAEAPVRECLVRVGEQQPSGNFPVYRLWMTQATANLWTSRHKLDNTSLDVTFVSGGDRVIYNAAALYAGSPYISPGYCGPACGRCGYGIELPKDDLFLGDRDLVLDWPGGHGNETTALQEQMGYWIADRLHLQSSHRYIIRLHVNGVTDAARQAVFEAMQQPAKGFLEQWNSGASDGQFFKIDRAFEFNDSGGLITAPAPTLQDFTTVGGLKKREKYRWNFMYRVTDRRNDYTNLFALVDAMNSVKPEPYTTAVTGLADIEQWMRTFATEHIIINFDAWGHDIGKNMYAYLPPGGKWQLYMCDLDWLMLAATGYNSSYTATSAPLFNSEDPTIAAMYGFPPFVRAYWRAVEDAVKGPLVAANCDPLMDAKHQSLVANGVEWCDGQRLTHPGAVKTWFAQRRTALQAALQTVTPDFAVNPSIVVSNGIGLVSGVAPVGVATVSVNGVVWPVRWTTTTNWVAQVPLLQGLNTFRVVGVDVTQQPVSGASNTVSVVHSTPAPSPVDAVVINELMVQPALPDAQYVELFNTSPTFAYDLSGWNFNGLGYTFPAGTFIGPRDHLVLARDRVAFNQAYGRQALVRDTFSGNLQMDGETLSLLTPGGEVVDRVRYEAVAPWPAAVAGRALQLVDAAQDNARVANWATVGPAQVATPQWIFVTATGVPRSTSQSRSLYLYLGSAGEIHLDDLSVVAGSVPGVGVNVVPNGGFESTLSPWTIGSGGNLSGSALSTAIKRSGNSSLRLVSTAAGTGQNSSIWQNFSSSLTVGATYTLSFWFLQTTNGGPLTVRFAGNGISVTTNPAPATTAALALATPGATNSVAATLPAFPPLWLNELHAENLTGPLDNAGEREPWAELLNRGAASLTLSNYFLSDSYTNPGKWAFPAATTVPANGFRLVWCDNQPAQSTALAPHPNFRLAPGAGTLALSRVINGATQLVDYLTYTNLPANYAYGDVPDGQPFYRRSMFRPSPGGTNDPALPPITVFLNEWLAENNAGLRNPANNRFDDWFELYNPTDTPAEIGGYYLTDNLGNPTKYRIPAGYQVPAGGFLLVWADEVTSANSTNDPALHVNFKLSKDGEALGIYAPDGSAIDVVTFGIQSANVSEGRILDGGALRLFLPTPTPAAPNLPPPALTPPTVTTFSVMPGGAATLSFQTWPGHAYRVEFMDDLRAAIWLPLTQEILATGAHVDVTDPAPPPAQRYYRVVQLD